MNLKIFVSTIVLDLQFYSFKTNLSKNLKTLFLDSVSKRKWTCPQLELSKKILSTKALQDFHNIKYFPKNILTI